MYTSTHIIVNHAKYTPNCSRERIEQIEEGDKDGKRKGQREGDRERGSERENKGEREGYRERGI